MVHKLLETNEQNLMKSHRQEVESLCEDYKNNWYDFVNEELIPANLENHTKFHEIGNIHGLCDTSILELEEDNLVDILPIIKKARTQY